jgi:hypothetical protein
MLMKLKELTEMSIRGGNLTAQSDVWAAKRESELLSNANNEQIGKIDSFVVKQHLFTVSVWDGNQMIGIATIDNIPNQYCLIDNLWVISSLRGKKLLSKLLLFLKIDRGYNKLALADVHSDDTYDLLKAGGLKSFKKHWENRQGKIEEFSVDTIDDFYGAGWWKLVLENTEDFSGFIKTDSFTHTYSAIAHAIDLHESLTD